MEFSWKERLEKYHEMEKVLTMSKVETATDVIFMGSSQVKSHLRRDVHTTWLNNSEVEKFENYDICIHKFVHISQNRILASDLWYLYEFFQKWKTEI